MKSKRTKQFFDGHLPAKMFIKSQINLRHSPSSEEVLEMVVAQSYSFQYWHD